MSYIPPPGTNLDPQVARAEQQAIELTAERHAQTHLSAEDRGRLGTRPQRLLHRLVELLRGRR